MSADLPLELCEAIIDRVSWEKDPDDAKSNVRTLGACSLVRKSWLPRSRLRLFADIYLPSRPYDRLERFRDFLNSRESTIAPYLRRLTLKCPLSKVSSPELPRLNNLQFLESLSINRGYFTMLRASDISSFFASFPNIKRLYLTQCHFATFGQLLGIIHSIPSLEHISIDQIELHGFGASMITDATPPSQLNSFHVRNVGDLSKIVNWLTSGNYVSPIHTVLLDRLKLDSGEAAGELLHILEPTLSHLTLGLGKTVGNSHETFYHHIDLSNHSKLSFLRLGLIPLYTDRTSRKLELPILDQVTSNHMQEIVIELMVHECDQLNKLDWGYISNILGKPNFLNLKKLWVVGVQPDIRVESRLWLEDRMPALRARGILHVSYKYGGQP